MRKIEAQMIQAIKAHKPFKSGNTQVSLSPEDGLAYVYLHGNLIAAECKQGWMINDCGWQTTTTKSRLNSILALLIDRPVSLSQRNNVWRLNDNGTTTIVEPHDMNLVRF